MDAELLSLLRPDRFGENFIAQALDEDVTRSAIRELFASDRLTPPHRPATPSPKPSCTGWSTATPPCSPTPTPVSSTTSPNTLPRDSCSPYYAQALNNLETTLRAALPDLLDLRSAALTVGAA